jgi:hypothetical protein
MLSYFPAIYPGELLYSVLARYHRHVGLPGSMHTLENLFGNSKVTATLDLPGHLQLLASRIPAERGLTVDRMIDTLTLYPYFIAFEPPSLQTNVRQAMKLGTVENLHIRLGLVAFRVARINRLRFCPECAQEMLTSHGELYWRRDHQLPSVLVCPRHARPLLESSVSFSQHSRHEFVAATPENCPPQARPIIPLIEHTVVAHLQRLARLSAELLDNPPISRTFSGWTALYRSQMLEIGLARSISTMDQQRLEEEFRSFYGRALGLLPNVMDANEFAGDWLAAMVRKHRKANHPLYHLLVQDFLAQRERKISPFGTGPWSCLNPLAQHSSPTPIKSMTQHRNRNNTVGVFACTCGYAYTRCLYSTTGTLGPPRFLRYGPLLEPALRKLVASGSSLRETGRALQLDPKTVVLFARNLGVAVPWALVLPGKISSKDTPNQKSVEIPAPDEPSSPRRRKPARALHDWDEIDRTWVAKLRALVASVSKESPPVRITVAELERRADLRGWLLKRKHHLPLTMAFLDQVVEGVEKFQLRRIHWAIIELEQDGGPVKAWKVMRMAGLRSDSLDRINSALEAAPLFWREAA